MSSSSQVEALYLATKLTVEEATGVLQSGAAVVVALGGMVESGKTTLLARIFEMFQCGTVAGYFFAASRTLAAFDRLTWHATMECGAASPMTEHTGRAENNLFLHLRIGKAGYSEPITDLLIADIPGEVFPDAVAERAACLDLRALRRADHVVLVLDGAVLCNVASRHDHCGKVVDFVTRALETGQIGQHTVLHLVAAKCDLISDDAANEAWVFLDSIERLFRAKFASVVGSLHYWRLAARPVSPVEPTVLEIGRLFSEWMADVPGHAHSLRGPERLEFDRDFCRFGQRTP